MKALFICLLILFSSVSATAASPAWTPDRPLEAAWHDKSGIKDNAAMNNGSSPSSFTGSGLNYGLGLVNVLGQSAFDSLGGKLRMQFTVDDDSKLMGEADLLLPLYDTTYSSVFTQLGVRSLWDDRWNANFGIGQRWYPQARAEKDGSIDSGAWMLGYNAFFDYDLSRSHQRGGVGVEAQYDILKLSSNYYFPLSGWKDAKGSDPMLDYYMERPAKGWDVRLRGELPFYREIALTGAYSQWYGDEVGMFGASGREKNPKVWSYGLEYTPVPLVTLYAEQSRTERGRSESNIGLRFTYTFGAPFEDAVTPAKRDKQRPQLDRRDFVDRENRIVLEYKQKGFAVALSGTWFEVPSQGHLRIGLVTTSGAPANAASWEGSAAPFITRSGPDGADFTLPAYDAAPGANNTYQIRAVARNELGQSASSPVATIKVLPSAPGSVAQKEYVLNATTPPTLKVGENDIIRAALTNNGVPVDSGQLTWTIIDGAGTLHSGTSSTDSGGKSQNFFTATQGGPVTVRVSHQPDSGPAVTKNITFRVVDVYKLSLSADRTVIYVYEDFGAGSNLTATLLQNGTPLDDAVITWTIIGGDGDGAFAPSSSNTAPNGRATTFFASARFGQVFVRASYQPASGAAVTRVIRLSIEAEPR